MKKLKIFMCMIECPGMPGKTMETFWCNDVGCPCYEGLEDHHVKCTFDELEIEAHCIEEA